MPEILIATHNLHKKEEIQQILGSDFLVKSLEDYQLTDEIVENGSTFEANALIKAQYCYQKTGIPSIGDDSGLVIESLDGKPGIFSARYAGDHDFEKNIAKVLQEMQNIHQRNAYFISVLCYFDANGPVFFEGKIDGEILTEKSGAKGFGYDPIFKPLGYEKSFAEMSAEEKNSISHRKKAIEKLLGFLL